jgi:hypothetical protein
VHSEYDPRLKNRYLQQCPSVNKLIKLLLPTGVCHKYLNLLDRERASPKLGEERVIHQRLSPTYTSKLMKVIQTTGSLCGYTQRAPLATQPKMLSTITVIIDRPEEPAAGGKTWQIAETD